MHLQPENIMFARRVEDCVARGKALRVKLIDLGMAAVLHTAGADTLSHSSCTTPSGPRGWAKALRALSGGSGGSGLRVGSFSLARSSSSTAGRRGRSLTRQPLTGCLGSPGFIAPEVVKGGVHTVRGEGARGPKSSGHSALSVGWAFAPRPVRDAGPAQALRFPPFITGCVL